MEVILLVVFVGQTAQKGFRPGRSGELLCKLPQQRCAHADDRFRGYGGHQLALKSLIGFVLQGKQLLRNRFIHKNVLLCIVFVSRLGSRLQRFRPDAPDQCGQNFSADPLSPVMGLSDDNGHIVLLRAFIPCVSHAQTAKRRGFGLWCSV